MDDGAGGSIFGVRLDDLPSRQALRDACARLLDGPGGARIFTPNPEILLRARRDPTYAEVLRTAALAAPDGVGISVVRAVRRLGRLRRWPGVDVAGEVIRLAAARGAAVVLLGGASGAATRAAARWRAALPGLEARAVGDGVAIGEDGRASDAAVDAELVAAVRAASPAAVLVGLGAPKQERWIDAHAAALPEVRVFAAVGGAFDIWSGRLPRAPGPLRRLGLEWAWRLALEPWRLPRAFRATVVFPLRALAERPG